MWCVTLAGCRSVTVLLPVGADPHSFEPTPLDAARLAEANLIFINGLDWKNSSTLTGKCGGYG
jgi:ABC-type Zn uptake system ZnuABC Zn-binding protein ZnuA